MRTSTLVLLLAALCSCSALILPGATTFHSTLTAVRTPSVTLQDDAGRYDDAEERGRAALEAMEAETAAAAKKQAALDDMAADAEAVGPFNPLLALGALAGGCLLGYVAQVAAS